MSYPIVRQRDVVPRLRHLTSWERVRHSTAHLRLLTEMVAELVSDLRAMFSHIPLTTWLGIDWCIFLCLRWFVVSFPFEYIVYDKSSRRRSHRRLCRGEPHISTTWLSVQF